MTENRNKELINRANAGEFDLLDIDPAADISAFMRQAAKDAAFGRLVVKRLKTLTVLPSYTDLLGYCSGILDDYRSIYGEK